MVTLFSVWYCVNKWKYINTDILRSRESFYSEVDFLRGLHGGVSREEVNIRLIEFYEGHLDAIDRKNEAILAFSLSYVILFLTIMSQFGAFEFDSFYYFMDVSSILGIIASAVVSVALVFCFFNLTTVRWQNYAKNIDSQIEDLIIIRNERTKYFRIVKSIFYVSFGLLVDFVLVRVLC